MQMIQIVLGIDDDDEGLGDDDDLSPQAANETSKMEEFDSARANSTSVPLSTKNVDFTRHRRVRREPLRTRQAPAKALTGVMLNQLLRNEQETRALCGIVYDTHIVPSQLSAVIPAGAQTLSHNEAVQQKGRGHGSRRSSRKGRTWERRWHRFRLAWKS